MPLIRDSGAPSNLADVIAHVVDVFGAIRDTTPIMVGAQYLKLGVGSAPRVVFVPERGPGKVGPPLECGNAASITHSCDVMIRASETDVIVSGNEDLDRLRGTYRLSDLVIGTIQAAATGLITWGTYSDDSPTDVDAYGAGMKFGFTYKRDLRAPAAVWALDLPAADESAIPAAPPVGSPASTVELDLVIVPTN